MSLIGTLEQFSLSNVLQRVETHEKTGLIVLKQGTNSVEFYFREGRLLCIGPVRTSATLGERLLQDGVISAEALQETRLSIGTAEQSETRMALALMDLGHVTREDLRAWAIKKTSAVLSALLSWSSGDIYFDEGTPPPPDRLLVSMSISSLLTSVTSAPQPAAQPVQKKASIPAPAPQTRQLPSQPVQQKVQKPSQPMQLPQTPQQQPSSQPALPVVARPAPLATTTQSAPAVYSTVAFTTTAPSSERIQTTPSTPSPAIERVPTLTSASQFFTPSVPMPTETPDTPPLQATEALAPVFSTADDSSFVTLLSESDAENVSFASLASNLTEIASGGLMQPVPVANPVLPKRMDTSFMQPHMVLIPVDLSSLREQNPQIQLTPQQWHLLTYADGRTSLQAICQEIATAPELVCQVAGELMAEGLIYVAPPDQLPVKELSPVSRELVTAGLNNGYFTPGYAANAGAPWSASMPAVQVRDTTSHTASVLPFETESQWGNGGNGATFIPGRGWITAPQPMLPLQSNGPVPTHSGVYAQVR